MYFNKVSLTLELLIIICALSVSVTSWVFDDDGCRTPNRGVGTCILAKNCEPLVNFLTAAPKPLPPYIRHKLRAYTCGYKGASVKVCCPDKALPIPLPKTKSPLKAHNSAVDYENHRNFHLLPTECGYADISDKISDGKNAALGEYPWMALIAYNTSNGPKFKCGGTVINDRYILTAAHCITNLKDPLFSVRVGEHDLSKVVDCKELDNGNLRCASPVQNLNIEEVIPHPNFTDEYNTPDGFNDIGLLRVSTMKFTDNVQPTCLPIKEAKDIKSKFVTISGWGFTETKSSISNILQKASLPILEKNKCQQYFHTIRISDKQICAKSETKDSCNGDSGGPLQMHVYINNDIRNVQYGIISFGGANCGNGDYPGIYTRIGSFIDWILDIIRP